MCCFSHSIETTLKNEKLYELNPFQIFALNVVVLIRSTADMKADIYAIDFTSMVRTFIRLAKSTEISEYAKQPKAYKN